MHKIYNCPNFQRNLTKDLTDPSGRNRTIVLMFVDTTYIYLEKVKNLAHQKVTFLNYKGMNLYKLIAFTTSNGKFITLLPLTNSISPSSGDTMLMNSIMQAEDNCEESQILLSLRQLLRGNERFAVMPIADAGFLHVPYQVNVL